MRFSVALTPNCKQQEVYTSIYVTIYFQIDISTWKSLHMLTTYPLMSKVMISPLGKAVYSTLNETCLHK